MSSQWFWLRSRRTKHLARWIVKPSNGIRLKITQQFNLFSCNTVNSNPSRWSRAKTIARWARHENQFDIDVMKSPFLSLWSVCHLSPWAPVRFSWHRRSSLSSYQTPISTPIFTVSVENVEEKRKTLWAEQIDECERTQAERTSVSITLHRVVGGDSRLNWACIFSHRLIRQHEKRINSVRFKPPTCRVALIFGSWSFFSLSLLSLCSEENLQIFFIAAEKYLLKHPTRSSIFYFKFAVCCMCSIGEG